MNWALAGTPFYFWLPGLCDILVALISSWIPDSRTNEFMAGAIEFVDGGTVTTPRGFSAGATYAGLKTFAEDKLDLGLILSEAPCTAAGVYTTNAIRSA